MIGALMAGSILAFLFGIAAWIADRTEPDDRRLYVVDDEAVRKLGEL